MNEDMKYHPNMEFALNGVPSLKGKVSDAEWQARVDLAASYRLTAQFGWDDMLSNHISARVPDEPDMLLINPYGVLFNQVTASCLLKADFHGKVVTETPFPINPTIFTIHGAVLEARQDVNSVVHLHTNAGVGVATQKHGLLPVTQRALYFQNILAYHDYEGIAVDEDERISLKKCVGEDKWLVLLRNHGTLTLGRNIAQAFVYAYSLERACEYQLAAMTGGADLVELSQEIRDTVPKQTGHFKFAGTLEWPALLANLDKTDASYKT